MNRVQPPVLHIRLGIGNGLVDVMKQIIRKDIERDLPRTTVARAAAVTAEDSHTLCKEARASYISESEPQILSYKKGKESFEAIAKHQEFKKLKEKRETALLGNGKNLTDKQQEKYDMLTERELQFVLLRRDLLMPLPLKLIINKKM